MGRTKQANLLMGDKLRLFRENKRLSQADVAHIIGVNPTSLSAFELNKAQPSLFTLKQLAELYEVSTDFLLSSNNIPAFDDFQILHRICRQYGGELLDNCVSILFDLTPEGLKQAFTYLQFLDSQAQYSIRAEEMKGNGKET